ncbi:hypothetical protein DFP72DRAFT_838497 [Ephemerocybe angulata]|uniref:Uncharacterized protein n=1 Tax=Ephemerocybe angulata TaxID=980116 RepID=A0A8H6IK35_9AGAR|nr:hypothetical protein DFP72DRAFT_838497 [Tulosesus angulatus]
MTVLRDTFGNVGSGVTANSKRGINFFKEKANNHEKTWLLLKEAQKDQNYMLLFGLQKNQKTTKDSKIAVAKRIASVVLPVQYAQDQDVAGSRLKGKADDLVKTYKEEIKKLQQTGGGLRMSENASQDANEYLDYYVGPEGPDAMTSAKVKNLWHGRRVLHLQPSNTNAGGSGAPPVPDAVIDPALLAIQAAQGAEAKEATAGTQPTPDPPSGKENTPAVPTGGKRPPKASTFDAEKHVKLAKQNLKTITPKATLEDVLMYAVKLMISNIILLLEILSLL